MNLECNWGLEKSHGNVMICQIQMVIITMIIIINSIAFIITDLLNGKVLQE